MALLTWSERLSIGVKAMDAQHILLIGMLNELHAAMMAGEAKTITGPLLDKLVNYTRTHFSTEEALLEKAGYPELPQHHKHHVDLTKQVDVFVARYQSGEEMINLHLMNFLSNWLSDHILEEDLEYGKWLNQRGVQ
jgi:hemerythrin